MINLLKAELFKLKKSKATLICLIILLGYILVFTIIFLLLGALFNSLEAGIGAEEGLGEGGILGMILPGYYGIRASSALYFFANDLQIILIIATIIICGFYSGEYRHGLIRNSLTVGQSREKVYFAKFIMTMIVSAAFYLMASFIYLTVYGIAGGWGSVAAGKFIGFWFLQLLLFLATSAVVFMLSVLTKSTGATIGIVIGMTFVFGLLGQLGSYTSLVTVAGSEPDLFFRVLNEISRLFPVSEVTIAARMDLSGWRLAEAVLVGAGFLAGAGAIGLAVFKKQDQK